MKDKVLKMLYAQKLKNRRVFIAPYRKGVNYCLLSDRIKMYADAIHYVKINRTFKKLGLTANVMNG